MSANAPKQWFEKAQEDLTVARLVLGEGHTSHACFLAQQAIEKALKAFLYAKSNSYPRTHRLVDLLVQCISFEPDFSNFLSACTVIDQYYIPTRYPDSVSGISASLTTKEAEEAGRAAQQIIQHVAPYIP